MKQDLLEWGRACLPHHFRRPPSPLHRWLADRADEMRTRRGTKLNLIGPRGGAKSTVGTLALPLREAIEGTEPYIWIVSDTSLQARGHLENIRAELDANAEIEARYKDKTGPGPVWRSHALQLKNEIRIEAFGTGQRVRGRRHRAHRPTLIVCDDLQNDTHIASALARENSKRWFHGMLLKAGTKETNILNLATALHRDALALELCRTPGWISKVFPALPSWPERMDLWAEWERLYCDLDRPDAQQAALAFYENHRDEMDQGAALLWPEEEDLYYLMRLRVEGGRSAFEREKQGSPQVPEDYEWPDDYFGPHIWFAAWPGDLVVKTIALDPSKGAEDHRGDYSAFAMLGQDARGTIYVEADLVRRPTEQIVADGVEHVRRFAPHAFGVEAQQLADLFRDSFIEEFRRRGIPAEPPIMIANTKNKKVRIRTLGKHLSLKTMRFKQGSPSTKLLVDQLRDFPGGLHDDGPDAVEMALRLANDLLREPHEERVTPWPMFQG